MVQNLGTPRYRYPRETTSMYFNININININSKTHRSASVRGLTPMFVKCVLHIGSTASTLPFTNVRSSTERETQCLVRAIITQTLRMHSDEWFSFRRLSRIEPPGKHNSSNSKADTIHTTTITLPAEFAQAHRTAIHFVSLLNGTCTHITSHHITSHHVTSHQQLLQLLHTSDKRT